jgi:SecD/SecF fusion protein
MRIVQIVCFFGMSAGAVLLALLSVMYWPPRMGVDLAGGVRWVYEIDREAIQAASPQAVSPETVDWDALLPALKRRVDPGATQGCIVRRSADWQVEIIAVVHEDKEVARIQDRIAAAGVLEFRVVANIFDHQEIIDLARNHATDTELCRLRHVVDGERPVGYWARVGRQNVPGPDGLRPLSVHVVGDVIRDASTGQLVEVPLRYASFDELQLARYLADRDIEEVEVLMALDDGFDVTGSHLARVAMAWDESGRPCVNFTMTSRGAELIAGLTGTNLPDWNREYYRRLGIMLDGTLLSAPRVMSSISDRGRITGSFTEREVEFLSGILQAGTLPVPLQRIPVSETAVAPDARATSRMAAILWISTALVLIVWVVMLLRHGVCGLDGCLASLLQILLTLTAILLLRVAVSQSGVLAAAIVSVVTAVGNTAICYWSCPGTTVEPQEPARFWRGLGVATALVALVFGCLLVSAAFLYALAGFPGREVAVAVLLGSQAALLTSTVCLPALIAMTIAQTVGADASTRHTLKRTLQRGPAEA